MPLSEAQGRWVAEYLAGDYALPSEAEMRRFMAEDMAAMQKRYVASKRHTIQVDFDDYLFDLDRELKKGRQRADSQGHRLPVAPLAAGEPVAA